MTHMVYLAMMMLTSGVPQQRGTEASMQNCTAVIIMMASQEHKDRHFWYCQPALANASLGPPTPTE